jgi:hypothetical protein
VCHRLHSALCPTVLPCCACPSVFEFCLIAGIVDSFVPRIGHDLPICVAVEEIKAWLVVISADRERRYWPERRATNHNVLRGSGWAMARVDGREQKYAGTAQDRRGRIHDVLFGWFALA